MTPRSTTLRDAELEIIPSRLASGDDESEGTAYSVELRFTQRLCRCLLRPPFAHNAVTALPGGRVRGSFKAPWQWHLPHRHGGPRVSRPPLCAGSAARLPMTRYYGVFASHHPAVARAPLRSALAPCKPADVASLEVDLVSGREVEFDGGAPFGDFGWCAPQGRQVPAEHERLT